MSGRGSRNTTSGPSAGALKRSNRSPVAHDPRTIAGLNRLGRDQRHLTVGLDPSVAGDARGVMGTILAGHPKLRTRSPPAPAASAPLRLRADRKAMAAGALNVIEKGADRSASGLRSAWAARSIMGALLLDRPKPRG